MGNLFDFVSKLYLGTVDANVFAIRNTRMGTSTMTTLVGMLIATLLINNTIGHVQAQVYDAPNTLAPSSSPMARTANMYRACAAKSQAPSVFRISMIVITWMVVALLIMSCIYGCFQCCTTRSYKSGNNDHHHRDDDDKRRHSRKRR